MESRDQCRIAITGAGLLSPLGLTLDETWEALLAGRFITDHARVPREFPGGDRATSLAIEAASQAIASAGWSMRQRADSDTALLVGTSKGPIESWISALHGSSTEALSPALPQGTGGGGICLAASFPSPGDPGEGQGEGHSTPPPIMSALPYVVGGLSSTATAIANALGITSGPRLTLSAACASGLEALIRAARMIHWGEARRVLVVATESSLHPLFLASFRRLGVLPPAGAGCRPFDEDRQGFLMSEAAAAICLEPAEMRPGGGLLLDGLAFAGDATHLTASDPAGATLQRVVETAIGDDAVDLIHAHGTGTQTNDPIELAALERAMDNSPWVYSHKGALGHSLGSSGLISIAINTLIHARGIIPPNVRTARPIATRLHLAPPGEPIPCPIRRSLVLAAGFGGAVAAATLCLA